MNCLPGALVLIACIVTACSHYESPPIAPVSKPGGGVSSGVDTMRPLFLDVRAEYKVSDSQWAIVMEARESKGGKEVFFLEKALFEVNGVARDLNMGFPFNGRPEKLFLRHPSRVLRIRYLSPENRLFEASLQLEDPTLITHSFKASATNGIEVAITPPIRANEYVDLRVYRSTSETAILITSNKYQELGQTQLLLEASRFVPSLGSSDEVIVEISRTLTDTYKEVFSNGIELTQNVGLHTQYVTVVP